MVSQFLKYINNLLETSKNFNDKTEDFDKKILVFNKILSLSGKYSLIHSIRNS